MRRGPSDRRAPPKPVLFLGAKVLPISIARSSGAEEPVKSCDPGSEQLNLRKSSSVQLAT